MCVTWFKLNVDLKGQQDALCVVAQSIADNITISLRGRRKCFEATMMIVFVTSLRTK